MPKPDTASTPSLFLIDGHSLAFQSFYAIRGLTSPDGNPTNALFGVVKRLQAILSEQSPTHMVVVFDSPGPTFRTEIFEDYKANREAPPEDFVAQLPVIFRALDLMGLQRAALAGYEADDIIGTFACRAADAGAAVTIVSADKDLFQLVGEKVAVLRTTRDGFQLCGPEEVRKTLGVPPSQVTDFLGLVGDASDNIPGVPGVGPKTAIDLLSRFETVEDVLSHLEAVESKSRRRNLEEHAESARLSKRLATIDREAPLELNLDAARVAFDPHKRELLAFYREMGFRSMMPSDSAGTRREVSAPIDAADESPANPTPTDYSVVTTPEDLERFAASAREAAKLALDTETTSLDTMRNDLVGISMSVKPGEAVYVPVGHRLDGDLARQPSLDVVREILGPLFADAAVGKIAQNAKYDMRVLARHGMPLANVSFDTMLASYVLNPSGRHGLKSMAFDYLGRQMTEIEELIGSGKKTVSMDEIEIDRVAPYACADADMTLRLSLLLEAKLPESGLEHLYRDIELPLVEVLDSMEAEGVRIDSAVLREIAEDVKRRLGELAEEIQKQAGRSFNIGSPRQVAEVLFEDLGLKPGRKTKTGLSTSSEVLEELASEHPLPRLILEYRHLDKMLSTYVEALPQMVHPRTGRIHTTYNQFVAATGRLSSSNPNLQNIPIRTDLGKRIRQAFLPSEEGEVLLAADYSQIELRILAHVCGDPALVEAFQSGDDIHTRTAARVFGMPPEMVTSDMRGQAKTINFGIIYGMGARRLSRQLDISYRQAQQFIEDYFEAFPGVRAWSTGVVEEAREKGYVSTLSGRRRPVADINSRSRNLRANAERMAVNTPIQGTAADMIKIAMVSLHRELQRRRLPARMILQVHDELVFSTPPECVEELRALVVELMEGAMVLSVPVKVDVEVGDTWAEC